MNDEQLFQKFRKRLVAEGILKAFLLGVIVGGGVDFAVAFVTWFLSFNGLWLSLGLGLGTGVCCAVLAYFFKFRPTDEQIARRVDALGLQERAVTMLEYKGDTSYIAGLQRSDTAHAIGKASAAGIKITVSVVAIIAACIIGALAPTMTTVTALSAYGVIDGGDDVIDDIVNRDVVYEVEYQVGCLNPMGMLTLEENLEDAVGEIMGDFVQVVKKGESTEKVTAVEEDGYVFYGWVRMYENNGEISFQEDGAEPTRCESDVNESLKYIAVFVEMQEGEDSNKDSIPDDQKDKDGDPDIPPEPQDPNDQQNNNNSSLGGLPPDNGASNIIDGNTYYRSVFEDYYNKAMQYLAENGTLPEHVRKMIEAYFGILA